MLKSFESFLIKRNLIKNQIKLTVFFHISNIFKELNYPEEKKIKLIRFFQCLPFCSIVLPLILVIKITFKLKGKLNLI